MDREKAAKNLEECIEHIRFNEFEKIPFWGNCQMAMTDALALLKEQQQQIWELQDQVEYLTDKLKEQEAIIEQYRRADGFLEAHGWKWEGR